MNLDTRGHMTFRWPVAVISIATLLGCSASPHRKYRLEPAAQFLFERRHIPTPCEQSQSPQNGPRLMIRASNAPAYNLQRLDRMALSRAELPVFTMRLVGSSMEVSGNSSDNYSVQLCAEAGAASQSDAEALLDEIKLTRDDRMLSLSMPKVVHEWPPTAFVQVQAPLETPITVNGDYASMRVIGMNAPVHLSTTHARITLLDTTGDVEARVESGIIDFSGDRGHVRLDADWGISLNFTAQHFDGSLAAKASETRSADTTAPPIAVLLPSGFASAFEVIVRRKSDFACRADICDHVAFHRRDGESVFTFGSGDPALHFTSLGGPVVMDSVDRLPPINGRH